MKTKKLNLYSSCFILLMSLAVAANELVKSHLEDGRYLQAAAQLEQQIARESSVNPGLYFHLGQTYLTLGLLCQQLAEDAAYFGNLYYESLEKESGLNPLDYYYHGLCLVAADDDNGAIRRFRQARKSPEIPYTGYAAIWEKVLSGAAVTARNPGEKLELYVARVERGQAAAEVPGLLNRENAENQHFFHNALIAAIAAKDFRKAKALLAGMDFRLLDDSLHLNLTGSGYTYYYYQPLLLDYLGKYFFARALESLQTVEKTISDPAQVQALNRRLAKLYRATAAKQRRQFYQRSDDPFLKNFLAELHWKNGNQSAAAAIWEANATVDDPLTAAYAGYFMVIYQNNASGINICKRAANRVGPRQLEIPSLIAKAYLHLGEKDEAINVLKAPQFSDMKKYPLFMLSYSKVYFAAGPNTFGKSLWMFEMLMRRNRFATQLYYYTQGVINNCDCSDGGRIAQ